MVLRKDELEAKLKDEHMLIESGILRDENPLDLTAEFGSFLEACRRGDLKTCQELISNGVNINGKDPYDYTPLIVVSASCGSGAECFQSPHRPPSPPKNSTCL